MKDKDLNWTYGSGLRLCRMGKNLSLHYGESRMEVNVNDRVAYSAHTQV